jgi:histone arginine demethylase JMJD6
METSFWMLLIEGRKLWRFFDPEDIPFLYQRYGAQTKRGITLLSNKNIIIWQNTRYEKKSTGSFRVDPLNPPDLEKFPLYAHARPYDLILGPGELLFVPSGCPHIQSTNLHLNAKL